MFVTFLTALTKYLRKTTQGRIYFSLSFERTQASMARGHSNESLMHLLTHVHTKELGNDDYGTHWPSCFLFSSGPQTKGQCSFIQRGSPLVKYLWKCPHRCAQGCLLANFKSIRLTIRPSQMISWSPSTNGGLWLITRYQFVCLL